MTKEYFFRKVKEGYKFFVYEVITPTILTRELANQNGYINKIVKRHCRRKPSTLEERDGFTILRIPIKKKDLPKAESQLEKLVDDIWSNNTLRKILGR